MADQTNHNSSTGAVNSDAVSQNDPEAQSTGQSPVRSGGAEKRSLFAGLFPFLRSRQTSSIREDLTDALSDDAGGDTAFSAEEKAMLNNILRLRELRVDDVMISRADIEAIEYSTPLGELLELFESSGHSRMPVYVETLDDARGMIHIRDVLNYITRMSRQQASDTETAAAAKRYDLSKIDLTTPISELNLMRKVLFVPSSMLASSLMARMQASHIQMALVIDEYGGTDGLVSLEDIVEMVVGDIEDEHDDEELSLIRSPDGSYIVDARAELEELEKLIGPGFMQGEDSEDVDTLSGLIISALDHIPETGAIVDALPDYELEVLEADSRRIHKVRITPKNSNYFQG
ncbi:hemolysin family protein [Pseudochrobactrum sp. sp1633]|uniref:hemolysin family protein n=1 Tax=Pseudochrobactrum sp. sp1633 TaxID=3036706 RepID=UPI0025A5BB04|nr:hemolysin family protein [Pseudochrobactrum sp. sp1633]MDM8344884.1 hemolysin family protein [Pseudochrobactrum sp. sp1633]HWD14717.1 hemolysin family protein [Pseudochrobactrum sp.]